MKLRIVKRKVVPVFFAADDKYVKYLAVSLKSLISNANTRKYKYHIHILNDGLSEVNKGILIDYENNDFKFFFDNVREAYERIKHLLPVRDYYNINTYYRFFIPTEFPQYDKAIYIDSDTIVLKSIHKLYNYNIKNYYLAAVTDRVVSQTPLFQDYTSKSLGVEPEHYFNAGVLLMNTKKLREIDILKRFSDLANFYQFKVAQDQDYFNVLCKGHVKYLDTRYNCQTFKDIPVRDDKIVIIHYNLGKKPWNDQYMPLGRFFWFYARRTEFYKELFKGLQDYKEPVNDSVGSIVDLVNDELTNDQNYWNQVRLLKLNEYRRSIMQKIGELEWEGKFDKDVELDPPSKELLPNKVDYLRKNPIAKFKAWFAFKIAGAYLRRAEKNREIIIKEVKGIENLNSVPTGAILTCNHFSAYDSFAVQHIYFNVADKKRKFYRVIKEGNYTSFPGFYGFLMRNCNTLPLSSNPDTMKKFLRAVKELLDNKNYILIYPEQAMWYNYRKPRPLKPGAFQLAVRNNVPIVPCFITMEDSDKLDNDGYPIQQYTIHIMKPIYAKEGLSAKENMKNMSEENSLAWKECYEEFYKEKL